MKTDYVSEDKISNVKKIDLRELAALEFIQLITKGKFVILHETEVIKRIHLILEGRKKIS